LIAEDDPIITMDAYRALHLGPHQKLVMTKHGGHAAWLGRGVDEEFGSFWMDQFVVQWVNWLT
jgi:predicted alpha/beta-fold hydrolase